MTCAHEHTEPVATREGAVCTDCGTELPANWGCPDCDWVEVRGFGQPSELIAGMPCEKHRKA